MDELFDHRGIRAQYLVHLVALWATSLGGYEGLRCGCVVSGIIEQRGVKVWFAVPGVVEVGRVGAINPMVLENVRETISPMGRRFTSKWNSFRLARYLSPNLLDRSA